MAGKEVVLPVVRCDADRLFRGYCLSGDIVLVIRILNRIPILVDDNTRSTLLHRNTIAGSPKIKDLFRVASALIPPQVG